MFEKVRATFFPERTEPMGRGTLSAIPIGLISGLGAIAVTFFLHTGPKFFVEDLIASILSGEACHYLFCPIPLRRCILLIMAVFSSLISGWIV